MTYLRNIHRHRGGLAAVVGLGYTADDAAKAVTPAEKGRAADFYAQFLTPAQIYNAARAQSNESILFGAQTYLPWLQSLLTGNTWTDPQRQYLTERIAAVQQQIAQVQDRILVSGQIAHTAGLQVLDEDRAKILQGNEDNKKYTLEMLGIYGNSALYNKFLTDAAAAKALTDAVAATTDAIVKAGGTYVPPGVTLPAQFLPANVAATATAQQKALTGGSTTGGTAGGSAAGSSAGGSSSTGSGTPGGSAAGSSALTLESIPKWVWVLGAVGVGLMFIDGGKHR
jgi:hypothetical protein